MCQASAGLSPQPRGPGQRPLRCRLQFPSWDRHPATPSCPRGSSARPPRPFPLSPPVPLSLQPLSQRAQGLGINGVTAQLFEGQRVLGQTGPKGSVGTEGWVSKSAERCTTSGPAPEPRPAVHGAHRGGTWAHLHAPPHPSTRAWMRPGSCSNLSRLHGSLCTQPRAWTRLAGGMGTRRLGLSAAPPSLQRAHRLQGFGWKSSTQPDSLPRALRGAGAGRQP